MTIDELRLRLMCKQFQQDRRRLGLRHAVDADRITHADEQRRPPGFGMSSHDRMQLRGHRTFRIADRHRAPLVTLAVHSVARITAPRGVDALLVLQQRLHRRRQRFPCGVLIGEQRVAADGRNDVAVEHGGGRRAREEAPIRVPRFGEDRRLLLGLATHLRDVRMAGHRAEVRIDAERADRRREALEVLQLQLLIRKRDDLMLQPLRANRSNLLRRERPAQIDTFDQRTARCLLRRDSHAHDV